MGSGASQPETGSELESLLSELRQLAGAVDGFDAYLLERAREVVSEGHTRLGSSGGGGGGGGTRPGGAATFQLTARTSAAAAPVAGRGGQAAKQAGEAHDCATEAKKHADKCRAASQLCKLEKAQQEAARAKQLATKAQHRAEGAAKAPGAGAAGGAVAEAAAEAKAALDEAKLVEDDRQEKLFFAAEKLKKDIEPLLVEDDEEADVKAKKIEGLLKAKDKALRSSNFDKAAELHEQLEVMSGKQKSDLSGKTASGMVRGPWIQWNASGAVEYASPQFECEAQRLREARRLASQLALLARHSKPLIKEAVDGCDWAEAKRLKEGKDRAESVKCALLQYATRFTENKMKAANPVDRFAKKGGEKES